MKRYGFLFSIVFWGVCSALAQVKVACIGDSITWGHGVEDRAAESYPAQLQKLLGSNYEVRNFGNPGRGVYRHTLYRDGKRGYIFTPEHLAALTWLPDVVICNLGINDRDEYLEINGKQQDGRFVADYCALLKSYADLPTQPKLFIWTKLAPLTSAHAAFSNPAPFLMQRDLEIVADRANAVGIDMQTPFETLALRTMPDGIHPNPKGAARIAEITAKAVTPYLTGEIPFTLPYYCSHNALLPCDRSFTIRGTASPGVTVSCGSLSTQADWRGVWQLTWPATPANAEGVTLAFQAGDLTKEVHNVIFGDLWVCAGQSNMDWPVTGLSNAKEMREAADDPAARILRWGSTLQNGLWNETQMERSKTALFGGTWRVMDKPRNIGDASGFAVMFVQELRKTRPDVPVGVIQIAVGGAPVEAFTPKWAMAGQEPMIPLVTRREPWYNNRNYGSEWIRDCGVKSVRQALAREDISEVRHHFAPETIWHFGFEPLFFAQGRGDTLPVKGLVWYQGESNAVSPVNQNLAGDPAYMWSGIAAMLQAVRGEKNNASLPVIMVQLPKFNRPWMLFRMVQDSIARTFPNVGLVISTDTGEMNNIHPKDKTAIVRRCLMLARRMVYGDRTQPVFTFAKTLQREDDSLIVTFEGMALDADVYPACLEISEDGETFKPVLKAHRLDDRRMRVSGQVSKPVAVRYNWAPDTAGLLFNRAKLPVGPFWLALEKQEQP